MNKFKKPSSTYINWLKDTWESPNAKYIFPFILLILTFIFAVLQSDGGFLLKFKSSFEWMLKYGAPLCLIAIGASLVLATGGVDISSSGVATLGGVIMAIVLNLFPYHFEFLHFQIHLGFILGIGCAVLFGYLSGKLLGYAITKSNSPPLIFSWSLGLIWFAAAILLSSSVKGLEPILKNAAPIITNSSSIKSHSGENKPIFESTNKPLTISNIKDTGSLISNDQSVKIIIQPNSELTQNSNVIADSSGVSVNGLTLPDDKALPLLVIILAFSQILWYTGLPRKACAVGANRDSAVYAGVSVDKTTASCYEWSAIFSSLAGVLILYQTSKASTSAMAGKEIIAIAVAVIGGTVMSGGYLNIFSVIAAAFFYSNFKKITNSMNFPNMNNQQQLIDTIFALTFILLIIFFGKKINGITNSIQVEKKTKQQ